MRRREILEAAGAVLAAIPGRAASAPGGYQIGAYYFPNYHVDPRNEKQHGEKWTEWELMKRAEPRFPGHRQPKKPLWGYEDEADPRVFARKIDAAADHGINHFIFDWYWYDDGPFIERGLERGYLQAANNSRLQFCLMWANHDWMEIQPAKRNTKPPILFPGTISKATWEKMTDYIVERYFRHPSHWQLDGRPYFSVYDMAKLVESFGTVEATRAALERFRAKTKAAGFPGLHLNAVAWGRAILPGESKPRDRKQLLAALGFDSTTSYVWVHHVRLAQFPTTDYATVARLSAEYWRKAPDENGLPYFPNVTMGWDPSPRTCQSDVYANLGYPFTPILSGNTPAAFREALAAVKQHLDSRGNQPKIFTVNAWNEWTEGSYLEPDTDTRMGYLEAIKSVFGRRS